jgi:DNA-binding transcriptional regulator WhiA
MRVKDELYVLEVNTDCCIFCEYAAIRLTLSGNKIKTKSSLYAERLGFLVKKYHNLELDLEKMKKSDVYTIILPHFSYKPEPMDECCMKAFVRGCYITSGRTNDIDKATHVEMSFRSSLPYEICKTILEYYKLDIKTMMRKERYVIYMKHSETASDFLTLIGAYKAVMEFENALIIREIRNNTNRAVNCDNANLQKASDAAYRQIQAIRLLEEKNMLGTLPKHLLDTAMARIENPELDLKELGKLLNPPISKAGTAHRLNRIIEIANKIDEKDMWFTKKT